MTCNGDYCGRCQRLCDGTGMRCGGHRPAILMAPRIAFHPTGNRWERSQGHRPRECRSPVSRILSPSCEAGRPFLSPRRGGAPCLRRVRLIPGNDRTGSPFPVLSCTTRGLPCRPVTRIRGGLLLHHFTLACVLADHRRYLSAALSVRDSLVSRPSLS